MTISSSDVSDGDTTNDSSIAVTFTSSEATLNFAAEDITVSGGTLDNFASSSSTVYTATFTPSDDGATSIDVSGNTFTDSVGNVNTASSQFNWTYDATRPSMTISSTAVGNGGSTNNNPITVTFTSSEPTNNFGESDISVSGGVLSNFSGSGTSYSATFTPTGDGVKTIDIPAGSEAGAIQLGSDVEGDTINGRFAYAVELSADGMIMAVGARGIDSNRGQTRVYKYDSGVWTQLGGDINGEAEGDAAGRSVTINADGTIVAIGAIYNDHDSGIDSGHVRVYQYLAILGRN